MNKIAVECDKCGKQVVVNSEIDSTGFLDVSYLDILAKFDLLKGQKGRDGLYMTDRSYCPICFLKVIQDWVTEIILKNKPKEEKK